MVATVVGVAMCAVFVPAATAADAAVPAAPAAPAQAAAQAPVTEPYEKISQADLSSNLEKYSGRHVEVNGPFLFTGSDFCYQVRKTKINTKDYLCFALGPVSLVRFYLKKDHPQMEELMKVKKGSVVKALGTFDAMGIDYKYIVVDRFTIDPPKAEPAK
jgi:hypothetical protein